MEFVVTATDSKGRVRGMVEARLENLDTVVANLSRALTDKYRLDHTAKFEPFTVTVTGLETE
jgi:hypothetical protein